MSTSAKFQITVGESLYYVMLVVDDSNCDIQVEPMSNPPEFEEGEYVVLPNSGVQPPQDPPKLVTLIAA